MPPGVEVETLLERLVSRDDKDGGPEQGPAGPVRPGSGLRARGQAVARRCQPLFHSLAPREPLSAEHCLPEGRRLEPNVTRSSRIRVFRFCRRQEVTFD